MWGDNSLMPLSFTRTLRLKVRAEAYAWLNAAAVEVNEVFNYCNETSLKAATRLIRTRMAKCVLDSGWGMLKNFLDYKSQRAARTFEVVSERNTSVTCSACGALSGPRWVNGLIVRSWVCRDCGELHDRDVNAARNILIGSRCRTSVGGNESSAWLIAPSNAYRVREARIESAWAAA